MFTITKQLDQTIRMKVDFKTMNEKGTLVSHSFTAIFARCDMDRLDQVKDLSNADLLRAEMRGWSDVRDDDRNEVPFSVENLEGLLRIPEGLVATAAAFWEGHRGGRAKN